MDKNINDLNTREHTKSMTTKHYENTSLSVNDSFFIWLTGEGFIFGRLLFPISYFQKRTEKEKCPHLYFTFYKT